MAEIYQLDFFKDPDISRLEAEDEFIFARLERVRKGTYKRLNQLEKQLKELKEEHELLKRNICKGRYETKDGDLGT